ncbi:MAG: prepilin peptidase [Acidobacteria bacterium]|nr:prepilin peptidase [Acidobacteriota bacterium]
MTDPLVVAVVVAGGSAAAVIDLRTRRVPDRLTLALAAAGLTLAAAGVGRVGVLAACAGALTGLVLMLPGHLFAATGGGDVKLLAAAGTLLGPAATWRAFVATLIAGGALAFAVAVRRRWLGRSDRSFAYAPAIAAGVVFAAVFP